ncbi:MAG: M6 family metalloprotease domain-containing protein, partial [Mariniphaga sp.]
MLFFKNIWPLILLLIHIAASGQISFVPASPYPVDVIQSDGTKLTLLAKGNKNMHYPVTLDGYTVIQNQKGDYEFATTDVSGKIKPSGITARNEHERTPQVIRQLTEIPKNLSPGIEIQDVFLKSAYAPKNYPSSGVRKNILLLIEYPDLPATTDPVEFDRLLNEPEYNGTGSFRDYYLESSNNNLDITTDVYGWFMASNNYEYYGDKNGANRSRLLVIEAIHAAENAGVDFSLYDNDNDGIIDNLMIVHSGPGAEEGSQTQYIWSHSWNLLEPIYYDNVSIQDYIIQPETRTYGMVGIGVFCHEFGHALGLPDLYDRDNSSKGLGDWCLMSYGLWLNEEKTPALMSAWCRQEMEWISPVVIPWPITESYLKDYFLNPAATSSECYKILTPNSNEYFLLENKYKTGFNAALPGSGLAIFHINTNRSNNDYEYNKMVDLEEADGLDHLDRNKNMGDGGDVFPGNSQNTVFDDYSYPNANTYDLKLTGINLKNISLNESVISFTLASPELPGPNLTFLPAENHMEISGTEFAVQMRIENNGNDPSDSCSMAFYISETLPATSGIPAGTIHIPAIPAHSFMDVTFSNDISAIPSLPLGNYFVGYSIDYLNTVAETDENDNEYSFDMQQITHNSLPNLTYNPTKNYLSVQDHLLTIELEVVNNGNSSARDHKIGYFLSDDQIITPSDFEVANDSVEILNSGQSALISITVDLSQNNFELPYGIYYAGFIIDYEDEVDEVDENDNRFVFTHQQIPYCQEITTTFYEYICEGDSIFFQDNYYLTEDEYHFNFTSSNGCDSLVILHLQMLPQSDTLIDVEICQGDSYFLDGVAYSSSGVYQAVLANRFGCDSTVTLNLTVNPS